MATKNSSCQDPPGNRLARAFLQQFDKSAVVDEIQNAPELSSYLQVLVDEHAAARFILTGSQNFTIRERVSQSLAGRAPWSS